MASASLWRVLQAASAIAHAALQKALSVRGYTLFEIMQDKARLDAAVAFITKGLESGALKPVVAKVFKLDDIVEAHRYLESNQQFGKIIVTAKG